ncbi:MAG: hypothetical protein ABH877_00370 [bacterium]
MKRFILLPVLLTLGMAGSAFQQAPPASTALPDDHILLTIFFRHDQAKTLGEINAQLAENGFYERFPPQGIEVVSWYVMMGIGQVVTIKVPPARLREVNRAVEQTAWKAYRTEFYATYDLKESQLARRKRAPAK